MEQFLIDSNAISNYFSASFPDGGMLFIDRLIDDMPNLSVITQIELLCWETDKTVEQKIRDFLDYSAIVNLSTDIVDKCVQLRRGRKMKTPDAIIAATALAGNYTLVTSDGKDFANIKGLKLVDPFDL